MKTILMLLMLGGVAAAETAPDFLAANSPKPVNANKDLAASDAKTPIEPSDVIVFPNDSSGLIESAVDQVDHAAMWLAAHPGYNIVVEGHTDSVGTAEYNGTLAFDRASAVRSRLQARGITPNRIVLAAYGESAGPVNINDRRVVMYATKLPVSQVALTLQQRGALRTAFQ